MAALPDPAGGDVLAVPRADAVPVRGRRALRAAAARSSGSRSRSSRSSWSRSSSDDFIWGDIFFPAIFGTLLWLAGRAVRSRSRLTAELHEATLRLHEQREAEARAAVAEERRRIAREMHDVVAHCVSTMVIQAGGARRILARDPERAVEAAALIERTGREALGEMRHLLGVLHAGENPPRSRPSRRCSSSARSLERSRAAGLPVELRVEGERHELPPGVDLAAYRVVQEALTNALKHGGGSAEVTRAYAQRRPALAVTDAGTGRRDRGAESSGQGLRRDARARPRVRRRAARPARDPAAASRSARTCRCRTRKRRRSAPPPAGATLEATA